jgi:hypothetical protein
MFTPNAKKKNTAGNIKLEPIKFAGGSTFLKELQKTVFLQHTTASSHLPTV